MRSILTATLFVAALACFGGDSEKTLPTLIDFGASKCQACKKLAPILETLREECVGQLKVEFVDVWKKENVKRAKSFEIDLIPTQVYLDPKGKEIWRHVGFISKADMLAKWKELGYEFKLKKPEKESDGESETDR